MSDAYDTVDFKPSWLGCSLVSMGLLVLFAVSIPFLIGAGLRRYLFQALVLFPVLSLLGSVCGLVAVRRSGARTLAGVALLANLTIFGCCVVAVLVTILDR